MQADYGEVYKETKSGKVVQAQMNLPQVKEDFKAGIEGSKFIGSDTYGDQEPDQFIVNKDLDSYSIKSRDMALYTNGLRKMFKGSPN